jgi:predicted transcriptional regulator of viral defense system
VSLSSVSAGISGRSRADLAAVTGHGRRFVTVDDAARGLDVGRAEAAKRLARWAEQGWLRRVRRDLYLAVPVDAVDPRAWAADPLVLAAVVWDPSYVTGWTSANHWGLTEQVFRTTVVRTTGRVRRSAQRLLDADYLLTHTGPDALAWGLRTEWREEVRVRIADPARTVVDVLDQPRLAGGIRLAAEILTGYLDAHDPLPLIDYADRVGNRTVFKRLGLLAERLHAGPDLLQACRARLTTGYPLLDPAQARQGPRSRAWGLVLNAHLDDLRPS